MAENDERVVELVARTEKVTLQWILKLTKNLVIGTVKGGTGTIAKGIKKYQTTGEQRYQQLKKKGALEHVDLGKTDVRPLKTELRRYKVDFSVQHNKDTDKYHVFFKAQDRDLINLALENVITKFSQVLEKTEEKKPLKERM